MSPQLMLDLPSSATYQPKAGGDMSLVTALQGHVKSFNFYQKDKTWGGLYNVATTIEQRDIDLVNSGNTWDVASLDMSAGGKLLLQGAQVNAAKGISAYGGTGYEERAAYDEKETVNNVRTKRTGILAYAEGALSDAINRPLGLAARVDIEVLPNKMDVQTKDIDSTRKAKVTKLDGGSGSVQRSTGGDAYIEGSVVKGASVGTLTAGGKVTAVGAMDTRHVEKSTYSRSLMWQKTESEGYIQQTLHLPKIHGLPPGAGAYQGAGGVSVQLPAGSSVRTQIEALSGQPGLEYLGELGQRSDIDWQRVQVINQSLNIDKQGLTPEGVIIVAIAVTIATAGTASAAGGAVFGAGTAGATAVAAGITTMATIAATSLINNGGNLGETLKELGSKDTLRAVAVSAATAGLTQGALEWAKLGTAASTANTGQQAVEAADKISLTQKTGTALARGTVQGLSAAMAESAILGTSFEEALGRHLTSSLIASLGAMGADEIGTHFDKTDALGNLNHKIAHAVLGCAVGAASADSSAGCAPGAVGAVIGELVAEWYGDASGYADLEQQRDAETDPIKRQALSEEVAAQKRLIIGISELAAVGGTAVLLQSGAEQLQLAKMTANNAVANNFLSHPERQTLKDAEKTCFTTGDANACGTANALRNKDELSDKLLANAVATCEGPECNEVSNYIRQQMEQQGCTAPYSCPDLKTLEDFWRVAQRKAQALEAVYPESWLLDAKAVLDLGKWGVKALSATGTGSLDALAQLGKVNVSARVDDFQQYDHFRKANSTRVGGEWDYVKHAPNDGAVPGSTTTTIAPIGTQLDRYGRTDKTYMSPADTPLEMRSMAPGAAANVPVKVEVKKPFEVITEKVAPAFDQPGGGFQIRGRIPEIPNRFANLDELIKFEYVKPIK